MRVLSKLQNGLAALLGLPTWELVDGTSKALEEATGDLRKALAERDAVASQLETTRSDLKHLTNVYNDTVQSLGVAREDQADLKRILYWPAADDAPSDQYKTMEYYTVNLNGRTWGAYPTRELAEKARTVAERMGGGYGSVERSSLVTRGVCSMCGREIRDAPNGQKWADFMGRRFHTACLARWDAALEAARESNKEVKA